MAELLLLVEKEEDALVQLECELREWGREDKLELYEGALEVKELLDV
jgi:hypothetical protein